MKTLSRLAIVLLVTAIVIFVSSGCASLGSSGASVTGAAVDSTGHLILTLSNGQTLDAGNVIGPQGPTGPAGSTVSFASDVPQVEPTIVRIDVSSSKGLDSGSGTIIDKRGYITTNAHVINGVCRNLKREVIGEHHP